MPRQARQLTAALAFRRDFMCHQNLLIEFGCVRAPRRLRYGATSGSLGVVSGPCHVTARVYILLCAGRT